MGCWGVLNRGGLYKQLFKGENGFKKQLNMEPSFSRTVSFMYNRGELIPTDSV